MKKIAIVSCRMIREQNLCPADAKCLTAIYRREGEFERYKGEDLILLGIIDCGGCEGNKVRVVTSLGLLKMQLEALKENIDAVHIGTCVSSLCPKKDDIIETVMKKAGVEVIEGTHKYVPVTIFRS